MFQVDKRDMDFALRHDDDMGRGGRASESIVRLRGLPFGCTKEEVANFFLGEDRLVNIGIPSTVVYCPNGYPTGL